MIKDFDLLHVRIIGFVGQHDFRDAAAIASKVRHQLEKLRAPGTRLLALAPLTGPADLLFAQEALALQIPLIIAQTQPPEELRQKFDESLRPEFDRVMSQATSVEPLDLAPPPDTTTRLGQKLVDESDILLAVSHEAGPPDDACAEVISYATRRGRSVICLWEDGEEIEVESPKSLPTSSEAKMSIEELQKVLGEPPPHPPIPDGLQKYFHACDYHATDAGPSVRAYVVNIVLANSVASMAGSVGSSFGHPGRFGIVLTVIKITCIIASIWMSLAMKKMQARRRWLELRLKAEVCRSAIATWNSPVAIEPLTSEEAPELRPLLQALRYYRATRHKMAPLSLDEFKASYGARLIEQYNYFEKQANAAIASSTWMSPLALTLNTSALFVSTIALCMQMAWLQNWPHEHQFLNFWIVLIPIVAPQVVTCLVAWQTIESVSRKRARFVEMRNAVHQTLVDLIHCHSWPTVQSVVKRSEKHLLSEVLEWYSFFKYSN